MEVNLPTLILREKLTYCKEIYNRITLKISKRALPLGNIKHYRDYHQNKISLY